MAKKKFTAKLKAKVTVAALKGHKTVNELVSEFDVHPTQISCWIKQLLDASKQIFGGKNEKSILYNIEQTFDGQPLYKTIEEKADNFIFSN